MSTVVPHRPEDDERRRRSFRLLTFLVAVVASGTSVLVTVTQVLSLIRLVDQTEAWWARFLALPTVVAPVLLGVTVLAGALTRGWSTRSRRSRAEVVDEPVAPGSPLERGGWFLGELYLVLFPLTVALLPRALRPEIGLLLSAQSHHAVAMYAMVATLLASIILSGARRWAYLVLVQVVTSLAFLSASEDPRTSVAYSLHAIAMSLVMMAASLVLQNLAYAVDDARVENERRAAEASVLAARLSEASRIDALVHDHILSALLLASRVGDPACLEPDDEAVAAVRRHAATALDTLDEIAQPQSLPHIEPLSSSALFALLERQVRALVPDAMVLGTGSRTTPVDGQVAHTIVAAATEAVRNSLRHAGRTAGDGTPVARRVTLHCSEEGVTTAVIDNGSGFDPAAVPDRRLGVRGSIVRRMESLDGGSAQVDSAIGEGTRVTLSWVDSRLSTRGHRLRRARHTLGDALLDLPMGSSLSASAAVVRHSLPMLVAVGLAVAASFTGMAVLTLDSYDPRWAGPACLGILVCCLLYALARTSVPGRRVPGSSVWASAAAVPAITAITMWAYEGPHLVGVEVWPVVACVIVLVVLSLAGRDGPAWLGLAGMVGVLLFHALATDHDGLWLHWLWVTAMAFVLAARKVSLFLVNQLAIAVRMQGQRAQRHVAETEHLEALQARRERSHHLDEHARPLLALLAGGTPLTEEVQVDAYLLEAELRDSLRARCFRGTPVVGAVRSARSRGVTVELMDDGALTAADEELRGRVEGIVQGELESAAQGTVTVRVQPPGRSAVVTVLSRSEDDSVARTEVLPDGSVLRSAPLAEAGTPL